MRHRISAFVKFYRSAKVVYDLHSPTAYRFAARVLEDRRWYYRFDEVEALRKKLLKDQSELPPTDFGAGSKTPKRRIAEVARHAAAPPALGRMLFRTALLQRPHAILELGTSLGISALYLTGGALQARFRSIEGNPLLAQRAQAHLDAFKVHDAKVFCGAFRQMLPAACAELGKIDLAYIDGDHRYEATLELFESLLPHLSENALLIFDDIHWSPGMSRAWETIARHPQVRLSIDTFRAGFAFFGQHLRVKQHLALVPRIWKPWRMGFL